MATSPAPASPATKESSGGGRDEVEGGVYGEDTVASEAGDTEAAGAVRVIASEDFIQNFALVKMLEQQHGMAFVDRTMPVLLSRPFV